MIRISVGRSGELVAEQGLVSPAVYLDHWALRAVSDDAGLGDRLRHVIEARAGTLVVSWANIAEFSNLDERAARSAEVLLDSSLPHVFFLDFNVFDVVRREADIVGGGPPLPPHADMDLLRLVVGLKPAGVQPVTCVGMLTEVSGRRLESTERMKDTFVEKVGALREEYLEDDAFRVLVDRSLRQQATPRGTSIVLREILAGVMRDGKSPIGRNDALDFFHTIVPVAYCDVVLLDGRWRDQVDRLRMRLERAGIGFPLATVLSGAGALEGLIAWLNS
jgi:hypothetical protein